MQNDKQLVDRFLASRSEKAFSVLYREKTPQLYQLALRLAGGDKDLASEQIQEMWLRVVENLERFEWRAQLKTWMTGILMNLFREHWRTLGSIKKHSENHSLEAVHNNVQQSTTALDLENAIAKLSAGYREIVILHDVEGYKHKEIAEMLQVSEGTSKSQLSRARAVLRKSLSDLAN